MSTVPYRGGENLLQVRIVSDDAAFEGGELFAELGVGAGEVAEADEGSDDEDAHLNRTRAVEDRRSHQCAVFGEGPGQLAPPAVFPT